MEFADDGWRLLIWLGLAAAGGYLLVSLWRLLRIGRRVPPAAVAARAVEPDLQFFAARTPAAAPEAPSPAAEPEAAAFAGQLAGQLSIARLQAELEDLRDEVGRLRREAEQQRAELDGLRAELDGQRQPRPVSPFYGEAMALAQRGYDALGIAEECGISVSEAELLLAMSGRPPKPARGEDNDGIWRGRAVAGR
jgi:hypothetical protein